MSLFGTSPPGASPSHSPSATGSRNLFDDDDDHGASKSSNPLFDDGSEHNHGGDDDASSWALPTPRGGKARSRADVVRTMLRPSDVPGSYMEAFDTVLEEDHGGSLGKISAAGLGRVFAAARVGAETKDKVMGIVAPAGGNGELGRNEFNVLLALVGLAQEGEGVSLDAVDERRGDLPIPKLVGINAEPAFDTSELAAKPPQRPSSHSEPELPDDDRPTTPPPRNESFSRSAMDYPADPDSDPWNTPDMHKDHGHEHSNDHHSHSHNHNHNHTIAPEPVRAVSTPAAPQTTTNGTVGPQSPGSIESDRPSASAMSTPAPATRSLSYTNPILASPPRHMPASSSSLTPSSAGGWGGGFFEGAGTPNVFSDSLRSPVPANPFGENPRPPAISSASAGGMGSQDGGLHHGPPLLGPGASTLTGTSSGRTGNALEEVVTVALMPEKEGFFLFQHHNYEVSSSRRGSKVVRRYSDFVWLLECLHKRYPFRALPPLPPKRVAVNGNHLSNDRAFMEKRRRGLARFLGALVRHPVLSQEQLVVMFLTVPTELAVWRKQATISVQEEFDNRPLPPGLEDSLPPTLEDLFARTRLGIKRSADLYIGLCNVMDRLVKRTEGVAADHGRLALSLASLTEATPDAYATDPSEVPLLNDGLVAMSKHLRTGQGLLEDESRAWEAGVLEDLKRQRDGLVSVREMFDRRDRLDRDNIAQLERRIEANEGRLAGLRAKGEGMVKPGEIEKVVEAIIKDKESIVRQHNRSVFVRECVRDELRYFQASQYHVSRWNQDWAQERVKYAEVLADNWRRLLDELEGMPLGE